jgi:hypothetical protein
MTSVLQSMLTLLQLLDEMRLDGSGFQGQQRAWRAPLRSRVIVYFAYGDRQLRAT